MSPRKQHNLSTARISEHRERENEREGEKRERERERARPEHGMRDQYLLEQRAERERAMPPA